MNSLLKKPSAFIPIIMSLTALAILLGYLIIFGTDQPINQQTDEGTAAHIFQILMGGQLPIIAFFIIKWFPKNPKQALMVLALQFVAGLLPMALLFFFEHR